MAKRRARDAAKEQVLSLAAKLATANLPREATEEQCERRVHELTLLSLRGFEKCITITGAPPLAPLHEGMHIAVAQHTKVATLLSVLLTAVSLAAQSILGLLPVDVSQPGVVGEMVVQFWL
jgi:hypothetical protein